MGEIGLLVRQFHGWRLIQSQHVDRYRIRRCYRQSHFLQVQQDISESEYDLQQHLRHNIKRWNGKRNCRDSHRKGLLFLTWIRSLMGRSSRTKWATRDSSRNKLSVLPLAIPYCHTKELLASLVNLQPSFQQILHPSSNRSATSNKWHSVDLVSHWPQTVRVLKYLGN